MVGEVEIARSVMTGRNWLCFSINVPLKCSSLHCVWHDSSTTLL